MKIAEITWHDAHQKCDESQNALSLEKFHRPLVVRSVGYVVRQDKVGITLAGCVERLGDDPDEESDLDRTLFIPRQWVRSIRILKR